MKSIFGAPPRSRRRTGGRVLCAAGVLVFAVFSAVCAGEGGPSLGGGLFEQDIQVEGGIFEFVRARNAAVIRNYGTITVGPFRIRARNLVYYYESSEIYAEGDVSCDEPNGNSFYADKLYYSVSEWRGTAAGVRVKAQRGAAEPRQATFLEPAPRGPRDRKRHDEDHTGMPTRMAVRADELRSINRDHQELVGAQITPSLFAKPHWAIESAAVNLRQGEKIESWHNVLKIGRVPVFYFPYLIKDLKYDWPWVRVGGGHTDDWGYHLLTKWGLDVENKESTAFLRPRQIFVDADFRQERGWGTGLEMEYGAGSMDSYGFLDTYFTRENLIGRGQDETRAREKNEIDREFWRGLGTTRPWQPAHYRDEERWAVDWWHRQQITERWDIRMEAHAYSDRDFRQEYFETDYKEDKEPETSADLRYLHENWELELVAVKRLNDWQTQSEYLPELRVTIPGLRLGTLPLYLRSDTRVGYVNRRFDTALDEYGVLGRPWTDPDDAEYAKIHEGDEVGAFFRAHTDTRVTAPIALGGIAKLTPYVGGRATYYGDRYGDGGVYDDEDDDVNSALLWGAELSSRFYGHFAGNTWRHVVEPVLRYTANEDPGIEPEELYYIDSTESYDEMHFFTFALHQKLQHKRMRGGYPVQVDVVDFNIRFHYLAEEEEADKYNYGREFTDIELDLVLRPTDTLVLFADARYDMRDGEFNRAHGGFDWKFRDRFRLFMAHQWLRGNYYAEPDTYSTSETTVALRTKLWDDDSRYSLEYALTYQWESNPDVYNGLNEHRLTLYRDLDTFELGISLVRDEKDDDQGVYFTLSPKGWVGGVANASAEVGAESQADIRYGHPGIQVETDEARYASSPGEATVETRESDAE